MPAAVPFRPERRTPRPTIKGVQTAIAARERGFKVSVLVDACATVDERMERISLEYVENVVGARLEHAAA